jgi:hypothetical protein
LPRGFRNCDHILYAVGSYQARPPVGRRAKGEALALEHKRQVGPIHRIGQVREGGCRRNFPVCRIDGGFVAVGVDHQDAVPGRDGWHADEPQRTTGRSAGQLSAAFQAGRVGRLSLGRNRRREAEARDEKGDEQEQAERGTHGNLPVFVCASVGSWGRPNHTHTDGRGVDTGRLAAYSMLATTSRKTGRTEKRP